MRLAAMALIGTPVLAGPAFGGGPGAEGDVFDVWSGACSAGSYTADASGRTPYPCTAMMHLAMAAEPGHELLIFVIKGDEGTQNGKMLGVGGMIDSKGDLQVARVQFKPGESTQMQPGAACKITRNGDAIQRVQCSGTASDGSGRALALDFAATGKMDIPK